MRKYTYIFLGIVAVVCSLILSKNMFFERSVLTIETYINGKLAATIPKSTDGYKVDSLTCTNGATATFNYSSWEIETSNITGNTTCTINFVKGTNAFFNDYLKDKACSTLPTTNDDAKDCLVGENGLRFQGKDPNNFVLYNNELWRVIGVFTVKDSNNKYRDLVKIIKYDILDVLAWNGIENNDWTNSDLKKVLNDGYYNATDTKCVTYSTTTTKTCKFSKTGLNNRARNMVESVVWYLGGIRSYNQNIEYAYLSERGSVVFDNHPLTWTGKVGLLYPSDYGYSVLESICNRSTTLNNYGSSECAGNSWLFRGDQYTITPFTINNSVTYLDDDGFINISYTYFGDSVHPVVYLKDTVRYISGNGTYSNPYIIE